MNVDMGIVAKAVANTVREHVESVRKEYQGELAAQRMEIVSLTERLMQVESRQPERGERGERGEQGLRGEIGAPGRDGNDADPDVVARMVLDDLRPLIEKQIANIPAGKDGRDGMDGKDGRDGTDGKDGAPGQKGEKGDRGEKGEKGDRGEKGEKGDAGEQGPKGDPGESGREGPAGAPGIDGKSVSPEDVMPSLMAELHKAVEAIPIPRDGASGKDGIDGKDGQSVTLDEVMPVVKAWGAEWALDFERRAQETLQQTIHKFIEKLPVPKDGEDGKDGAPGKDGRDALSLEDFQVKLEGRALTLTLERDDVRVERTVKLPVPLYLGVWRDGQEYEKGDNVTHDGSTWICRVEKTKGKPGEYNRDWQLCVKRGRNGKSE